MAPKSVIIDASASSISVDRLPDELNDMKIRDGKGAEATVVDGNGTETGHIIVATICGRNGQAKQVSTSHSVKRMEEISKSYAESEDACIDSLKPFTIDVDGEFTISHMAERVIGHGSFGLVFQTCRALAYIHGSIGVCHRDIKPQNLLVNPHTHQLKICDFGSAKVLVKGPLFPGENAVDQLVEIIKLESLTHPFFGELRGPTTHLQMADIYLLCSTSSLTVSSICDGIFL
ncbi:hypothetical protein ZIOFF_038679 [Zingiber officinale]|uniref:Protein kinase domain-containing protein n=1 Tax=Zingiber officinale TaxID=94328 RepID=A0A8J5L2G2_ZINOF|nr:hypothetical protein ZIOFF_038679 [Zingiber officinale]